MIEPVAVKFTIIDEMSQPINKIKGSAKDLSTGFDSFKTVVASAFGAVSVGAIINFGKAAISAFEESERAARRLGVAMKANGETFSANEKELKRVTSALIYKTGVADEAQYEALTKLTTITGSFTSALALLPEVMDLASFAGTDLNEASVLFGNILEGNTEKLPQYLKFLKDMKDAGASNTEIINALRDATKGYAEASATETQKIGAAWGEMVETIGAKLASSGIMKFLEKEVSQFARTVSGTAPDMKEMYNKNEENIKTSFTRIEEMTKAFTDKNGNYFLKSEKKLVDAEKEHLSNLYKTRKILMDEISSKEKADEDSRKKAMTKADSGPKAMTKEEKEKLKKEQDEWNAYLKEEQRKTREEGQQATLDFENKLKEKADKSRAEELEAQRVFAEGMDKINENLMQANVDRAEREKMLQEAKGQALSTGLSGMTQLLSVAASKNKEFAVAAKAMAISEATVNTYLAATKALASAPPPWNFIAAGGVVASGLANVAMITQQTFQTSPGFDKTIPGTPNQMVMFMGHGGERVGRGESSDSGLTINLQIPPSSTVDAAAGKGIVRTLERLARDGHLNNAFNLKKALAA